VLRDGRFLDLQSGVAMASQLDGAVVNVNMDLFRMVVRMQVMVMNYAFRRLEIGFHGYLLIAKSIYNC
jgi:hypothetical protein